MKKKNLTLKLIAFFMCTAIFGITSSGCIITTDEENVTRHETSYIAENTQEPISEDKLETGRSLNIDPKTIPLRPLNIEKSISIGNALEAPRGISWGVEMEHEYFDYIKEAGFDTVRVPVRFSDYNNDDYILEESFMEMIDCYIGYALNRELNVILDLHHFEEIMSEPAKYKAELIAIWEQLAERYKDYPENLVFEILNEPKDSLRGDLLNEYISEVIQVIRLTNPTRLIIFGGERYNSIYGLRNLSIPDDENIMITFHYYEPNEFAFQGNIYHKGFENLHSITWTASEKEMEKLVNDFMSVKAWADEKNVKIFLGEFGIVKNVPAEYRGKWIKAVKDLANELGFSWCYWELSSHFGIFNAETLEWDREILDILML